MEISENSDWNRVIINKRFLICKELKITENSIIHLGFIFFLFWKIDFNIIGIDKKNNMKIAIKIEDINDQFNKSKKMNHLLKKGW